MLSSEEKLKGHNIDKNTSGQQANTTGNEATHFNKPNTQEKNKPKR